MPASQPLRAFARTFVAGAMPLRTAGVGRPPTALRWLLLILAILCHVAGAQGTAPEVRLVSPEPGSEFAFGETIPLEAEAESTDPIAKVEFFANDEPLGEPVEVAPYRITWENAPSGTHAVFARATTAGGATADSALVEIVVGDDPEATVCNDPAPAGSAPSPACKEPSGTLMAVDNPCVLESGSETCTVALRAEWVPTVEFNVACVWIRSSIDLVECIQASEISTLSDGLPWDLLFPHARLEQTELELTAQPGFQDPEEDRWTYYGRGKSLDFETVWAVQAGATPPTVELSAPADGSEHPVGATIELVALANASAGRTAQVRFFADGLSLGAPVSAGADGLFRTTWSSTVSGPHVLEAQAIDDAGLESERDAVTVHLVDSTNQPPQVTLEAPSPGARFEFGTAIELVAFASDADGQVVRVEFQADDTLLGAAEVPGADGRHRFTWTGAPLGTHTLVAHAIDDQTASATSNTVTIEVVEPGVPNPSGSLQSDSPCTLSQGATTCSVTLEITFHDAPVVCVWALEPLALHACQSKGPVWNSLFPGVTTGGRTLELRAHEQDPSTLPGWPDSMADAHAQGVLLDDTFVAARTADGNQAPTVRITSPASDNQQFPLGVDIEIEAEAQDADGEIARVEFLADGVLIGSPVTAVPYRISWRPTVAGSYRLRARATDEDGATAASDPVTVQVVGESLPTPVVTLHVDSQNHVAPADIAIRARVTAPTAATSVAFLADGTVIHTTGNLTELSNEPGSWVGEATYVWASQPAGAYALRARASGPNLQTGESATVTVEVDSAPPIDPDDIPDVDIDPLTNELVTHDPTVGALAGQPGVRGGAANYEIPIVAPPGRRGMQPALALTYNSRGGNGIAGMGWSLSGLSSIHRCPRTLEQDDGEIHAVDFSGKDRLCLDGQRLVPAGASVYGSPGAVYRTEIDSFVRITQMGGDLSSLGTWFKVEWKNGEIAHYGAATQDRAAGARHGVHALVVPGGAPAPLSWLIERRYDRVGNAVRYIYQEPCTSDATCHGEVLVKEVRYTEFRSADGTQTEGNRAVAFTYEPRPGGLGANDVASSYLAGFITRQTQRLKKISVYAPPTATLDAEGGLVRDYSLGYEVSGSSGRSLLASVSECAYDDAGLPVCRDGLDSDSQQHRWTTFEWQHGSMKRAFRRLELEDDLTAQRVLGDFDGDGINELLAQGPGKTQHLLKLSADRQVVASFDITSIFADTPLGISGFERADFDGDGRIDLVSRNEAGEIVIYFWDGPSDADSFEDAFPAEPYNTKVKAGLFRDANGMLAHVGDVNGDGTADLVVIRQTGVAAAGSGPGRGQGQGPQGPRPGESCRSGVELEVHLNHAPGRQGMFTPPGIGPATVCLETVEVDEQTFVETIALARDLTGNGMVDFLLAPPNPIDAPTMPGYSRIVRASRGNGSKSYQLTPAPFASMFSDGVVPSQVQYARTTQFWLDVNGDGLPDYLYAARPASGTGVEWRLHLNTGGRFAAQSVLDIPASDPMARLPCAGPGGTSGPDCADALAVWYAGRMQVADLEADGRHGLLMPGRIVSHVCSRFDHTPDGPIAVQDATSPRMPVHPSQRGPVPSLAELPQPSGHAPPGGGHTFVCPEDPRTFQFNPASGSLSSTAGHPDGVGDLDVYLWPQGLYQASHGDRDNAIYAMDAIRFVERADGRWTIHRTDSAETGVILGPSVWLDADLYGDGLNDTLTTTMCIAGDPNADPGDEPDTDLQPCALFADGAPPLLPDASDPLANNTFLSEGRGPNNLTNPGTHTPQLPDLLASVRDGLGRDTVWTYFPLSSHGGRQEGETPLYTIPTGDQRLCPDTADPEVDPCKRDVDRHHIYFASSMPVVSEMAVSDGLGSHRVWEYGYGEAMYHTKGRGFQGFRKVIEEDVAGGVRTTTLFHQKFPLAGQPQVVVRNARGRSAAFDPAIGDIPALIERTRYHWRCDRADRNNAEACSYGHAQLHFPYLDRVETTSYDVGAATDGVDLPGEIGYREEINAEWTFADATACTGTAAAASGFDERGNLRHRITRAEDRGGAENPVFVAAHCEREATDFIVDANSWWLDKLDRRTVERRINYSSSHGLPAEASNPPQVLTTHYFWNNDRTPKREILQQGIPGQEVVTEYGYPDPSYGLPDRVGVTASGDEVNGERVTLTTYSDDGYFPSEVTNAVGHKTTTRIRPRDGQPAHHEDANGLVTTFAYDPFGWLTLTEFPGPGTGFRQPAVHRARAAVVRDDRGQIVADSTCGIDPRPMPQCDVPLRAYWRESTRTPGQPTRTTWFDQLGRPLREHTRQFGEFLVRQDTVYNARGLVVAQSEPYRASAFEQPRWTTFEQFDLLGRPRSKTAPRGLDNEFGGVTGDLRTVYTYAGRHTAITVCGTAATDRPCLSLSRTTDHLGRVLRTVDAKGGETSYWFDPSGNALVLRDANGVDTRARYNALGHRIRVEDPNQGSSRFEYNALGEVLKQVDYLDQIDESDANAQITEFQYDALGRLRLRTARGSQALTDTAQGAQVIQADVVDEYVYDADNALGQPRSQTRTVGAQQERHVEYLYDALARRVEVATTQRVGEAQDRHYTHRWAYDVNYGRLKGERYPNGVLRQFVYDRYGHLVRERDPVFGSVYRELLGFNARGQTTLEQLGAINAFYNYHASTGQARFEQYSRGSDDVLREQAYGYDVFGNLTLRELGAGLMPIVAEHFGYDELHRLTSAVRSGATSKTTNYDYDAVGNFTLKSDYSAGRPNGVPDYVYGDAERSGTSRAGPNAVRQVRLHAGLGGHTVNFVYDGRGNLMDDGHPLPLLRFGAVYDHRNLPVAVQRGTSAHSYFGYGADDQRTRQVSDTEGTRVYLPGFEDVLVAPPGARRESRAYLGDYATVTVADGRQTVRYLLKDHLGSVDAVADTGGQILEKRGYDAFGRPRKGEDWSDLPRAGLESLAVTQKGFTQHEHLGAVELIHMNGRAYDPNLGRFLSVDPFIQFPLNSQSLNPYSYIMNNPMSGTDPTGYFGIMGGGVCDTFVVCTGGLLQIGSSPGSNGVPFAFNGAEGTSVESRKDNTAPSELGKSDKRGHVASASVEPQYEVWGAEVVVRPKRADYVAAYADEIRWQNSKMVVTLPIALGVGFLTGTNPFHVNQPGDGSIQAATMPGALGMAGIGANVALKSGTRLLGNTQSRAASWAPTPGQVGSFSRATTPWSRSVWQRSDIDWGLKRPDGMTNLEAASRGYAPMRQVGDKFEKVQLHHLNQDPSGNLAEVWDSTHHARQLHNLVPPPSWRVTAPDAAAAFRREVPAYWRWRANGIGE